MIGNRYHDRRIVQAGLVQQGAMLRRVGAALVDEGKRHHLDTMAAIANLFMSSVRKIYACPDLYVTDPS